MSPQRVLLFSSALVRLEHQNIPDIRNQLRSSDCKELDELWLVDKGNC